MSNLANTASPLAMTAVGENTLGLLFGVRGRALSAEIFAELLRLASAQVHLLTESQSLKASLARLAALYRLAPGIAMFLPVNVAAQLEPLGPMRPHARDENANRREAVVHAVLLLELRGVHLGCESSISRNLWKIECIAADFLTVQFRAAGGSDKTKVSPEPVTAKTILTWIRRYEDDPIWGLYNRPRRQPQPADRDFEYRADASPTDHAPRNPSGYLQPSNAVPFETPGRGRNLTFVPWWLKDFS
jgi:hypothetical protein